ncbi:hypothetical protein KBD69_02900 [Candidatus Woesebacteria bacterium]|nr:hypothetical protein [Candidatus Woesebacteria bacterium]
MVKKEDPIKKYLTEIPKIVRKKIGHQYMPLAVYAVVVYTLVPGTGYYEEKYADDVEIRGLFEDALTKLLLLDPDLPSKYDTYLSELEELRKNL